MITYETRLYNFWYNTPVAQFRQKIGSKKLKQAFNLAQKAFINFFRPLCKKIDYQTLNCGSHPALFMKKVVSWSGFEPKTSLPKGQDITTKLQATTWLQMKPDLLMHFSGWVWAIRWNPKRSGQPLTLPRRHSLIPLSQCVYKLTINHSPTDCNQLYSW